MFKINNENRAVEIDYVELIHTDPTSLSDSLLEPLDMMTEATEKKTEEAPLETEESLNDGQASQDAQTSLSESIGHSELEADNESQKEASKQAD